MDYKDLPKKKWGPGPWQDEPDKEEWVDADTGLTCHIRRNMLGTGSLCGYVGVPPTHPAHGLSYNGVTQSEDDEQMANFRAEMRKANGNPDKILKGVSKVARPETIPGIGEALLAVRVHGGLTYSGALRASSNLWHFGFDCSHAFDLSPMMEATLKRIHIDQGTTSAAYLRKVHVAPKYRDVYRDINYVRGEVTSLAQQLKVMERPFVMPKLKSKSGRS